VRRIAIVTAAGRGIGAGIARRLATDSDTLGMLSPGQEAVAPPEELGGVAIRGSVTEREDVARLVEATVARFGRLDARVVSLGHLPKGALRERTDAEWRRRCAITFLPRCGSHASSGRISVPPAAGRWWRSALPPPASPSPMSR
jgi:NAD(P)-dependent dehydrogenase (short-subunit alcohol dehydrogenase family)